MCKLSGQVKFTAVICIIYNFVGLIMSILMMVYALGKPDFHVKIIHNTKSPRIPSPKPDVTTTMRMGPVTETYVHILPDLENRGQRFLSSTLLIKSLFGFALSVVLLIGAIKRKPSYVYAFYVYLIVIAVMYALLIMLCIAYQQWDPCYISAGSFLLIVLLLYFEIIPFKNELYNTQTEKPGGYSNKLSD